MVAQWVEGFILICLMLKFPGIDKIFSAFQSRQWMWWRRKSWNAMSRSEKGARGEALARVYCSKKLGYRCLVRNWRSGRGEIDLICLDGTALVFVEVRLRPVGARISGVHSIDAEKKAVLRRTARAYLQGLKRQPKTYRFDVVSIAFSGSNQYKISHYRNVALF